MANQPPLSPKDVALAFVDAINRHDVGRLCTLMTEGHRFIDSLGAEVRGREPMRRAWLGYFHMVPDFTIRIDHVLCDAQVVALFGLSRGTFTPDGTLSERNRWSMPSAWRAIVAGELVAEWQVYADNEPVRIIIANQNSGGGAS